MSKRDSKGKFTKDEARQFQLGDRVRSITGIYSIRGEVGTINKVREDGCCYVGFGDEDDWFPGRSHWPDQMELVEPAPQSKAEDAKDQEIERLKAEVERLKAETECEIQALGAELEHATRRADAAESKLTDIKAIVRTFKLFRGAEIGSLEDAVNHAMGDAA